MAYSGADDEGFPGGFDDLDGHDVEVVDAHQPADLAEESFDEAEVAAMMRVIAGAASPSAGCAG